VIRDKKLRSVAFAVLAVLLFVGVAASLAARQEKAGEKPAAARAAKPGAAEMERLEFYLGEWEYTESYPKSAASPNGAANTGIYISKLGPGGNSLINTFHSQGPVGDFEGMLVMTWDPREKAYKAYVFGNESTGAIVETGTFEGEALVYHTEFTIGNKTLKSRNVTHLLSADKLESDVYSSVNDGPEKLLVHVSAVRKH
jgi:hypothetical protein